MRRVAQNLNPESVDRARRAKAQAASATFHIRTRQQKVKPTPLPKFAHSALGKVICSFRNHILTAGDCLSALLHLQCFRIAMQPA